MRKPTAPHTKIQPKESTPANAAPGLQRPNASLSSFAKLDAWREFGTDNLWAQVPFVAYTHFGLA
jgi:hypothetical protein